MFSNFFRTLGRTKPKDASDQSRGRGRAPIIVHFLFFKRFFTYCQNVCFIFCFLIFVHYNPSSCRRKGGVIVRADDMTDLQLTLLNALSKKMISIIELQFRLARHF